MDKQKLLISSGLFSFVAPTTRTRSISRRCVLPSFASIGTCCQTDGKTFDAKTYENSVFYKHYFNWVLTRISVLWVLFFILPGVDAVTKIKAIFSATFSKFSPRFLPMYRILKYFEKTTGSDFRDAVQARETDSFCGK